MEKFRKSPSPRVGRHDAERGGRLSSRSNTPDIVANTTDNTSSDDQYYYEDPTNSTNTSQATTPVCCIDSKSHYVPPPPSQFPAKFNVNSYPICDIPMQSVPSVPYHQKNEASPPLPHSQNQGAQKTRPPVIYANTSSNRGDSWQNRTRDVPIVTSAGRSHVTMPKRDNDDLVVNPNEIYAKVDKTRKKETTPKKTSPTYQNTDEIDTTVDTTVVAMPNRKETKVTVEKTSPVDAEDVPREIPNTNIAVAFVVTCCFNMPIGALAIYCSLVAARSFRDGKIKKGKRRTQISMFLSLFGIVTTVLLVMGMVLYLAMSDAAKKKRTPVSTGPRETDINL